MPVDGLVEGAVRCELDLLQETRANHERVECKVSHGPDVVRHVPRGHWRKVDRELVVDRTELDVGAIEVVVAALSASKKREARGRERFIGLIEEHTLVTSRREGLDRIEQ